MLSFSSIQKLLVNRCGNPIAATYGKKRGKQLSLMRHAQPKKRGAEVQQ